MRASGAKSYVRTQIVTLKAALRPGEPVKPAILVKKVLMRMVESGDYFFFAISCSELMSGKTASRLGTSDR
jgi:hypothetical protein